MTARKAPAHNGALGMSIDALRDELGLPLSSLAERTGLDETDLYRALSGEVPVSRGLRSTALRELADVLDFEERVEASA